MKAVYILHRFSGVTQEDLENTTMSLRDVQAVLLNMFSAESILIGHSLESDLLALKVLWLPINLHDFFNLMLYTTRLNQMSTVPALVQ